MHFTSTSLPLLVLLTTALSAPTLNVLRAANPCFVIGATALPAETETSVQQIQSAITCDASTTTLSGVPDVSSGGVSFSSIDFSKSSLTPLNFALTTFATTSPLAANNLTLFQNELNVYLATEAGIRSVAGSLAIKDPKFFLSFQIARIQTAQGVVITDPSNTVEHLLGKVTKNGASESQATLDQVTALASDLS